MGPNAYPDGTSAGRSRNMAAIRRRDTKPERTLRSALHLRGWRYRVDMRLHVGPRYVRPDVAFTARRVAIFVDGCFWHGCPQHGGRPRKNADYWNGKLAGNIARDRQVDLALRDAGWTVVRIWEHEDVGDAVARIEQILHRCRRQ